MMSEVPTKDEILARIKRGPAQFIELAKWKESRKNPAHKAARAICKELVESGEVLHVNIGWFRYYIANTEAAKRAAIRQQIEEGSKRDKATGCILWCGTNSGGRGPSLIQNLSGFKSGLNIRRWLFSDLIGRELNGLSETVRMRAGCDDACINPRHMKLHSRSEILSGKPKSLKMRLALYKTMCEKYGTKPEMVQDIRSSDKTPNELAEQYGMTRDNIIYIRSGQTHKLLQGCWAGLGL